MEIGGVIGCSRRQRHGLETVAESAARPVEGGRISVI